MSHNHEVSDPEPSANRRHLVKYAGLSILAAVATIALKMTAYVLTDSVGLLSDAMESLVNLAAALMALWVLVVAARPADDSHHYGHSKAEYFSSGVEGALILVAASAIAVTAIDRLLHPQPLQQVGVGLIISVLAALINGAVAWVLLRAGRQFDSVTLRADGHHLMTDVWTSAGVVLGVGLVGLTGWQILDPLIALAVAANILWVGGRLFYGAVEGLMDASLPADEARQVLSILEKFREQHPEIGFHALRTRRAAARRFVSVHVLVPGHWSVKQGHDIAHGIECEIQERIAGSSVITHLEPIDDPISYEDVDIDRHPLPGSGSVNL